jgi:hypothetical protein
MNNRRLRDESLELAHACWIREQRSADGGIGLSNLWLSAGGFLKKSPRNQVDQSINPTVF